MSNVLGRNSPPLHPEHNERQSLTELRVICAIGLLRSRFVSHVVRIIPNRWN
jgi:hypothetical protein